jgi:hypothetical protein
MAFGTKVALRGMSGDTTFVCHKNGGYRLGANNFLSALLRDWPVVGQQPIFGSPQGR